MAKISYIIIHWLHDIGFVGVTLMALDLTEIVKQIKEPIFLVVFLVWGYLKIANEYSNFKNRNKK